MLETRAQLVTTMRGLAREQGVPLVSCIAANFAERVLASASAELLTELRRTTAYLRVMIRVPALALSRNCCAICWVEGARAPLLLCPNQLIAAGRLPKT